MRLKPTLMVIMLLFSGLAQSNECPSNLIEILEGKKDTNLYKKRVAELCRGQEVQVKGKVYNVDQNGDGYELRIDSIPGSNVFQYKWSRILELICMR